VITKDFLKGQQVEARTQYLMPEPGKVIAGVDGGIEQVSLVPGPGEVIVGSADGPVARSVSEIGGDDNFITSVDNTATISLSVDSDGKLAANVIANYAAESHTHSEDDITGLSARLSAIEARLDALEGEGA